MDRVRAIFISDTHLGCRHARTRELLDWLDRVEADTIYLVGDIIDGWKLRRRWHWPAEADALVHRLIDRARGGVAVRYAPGNHDDFLRDRVGFFASLDGVELNDEFIHETADGRRLLVIHGDQFDAAIRHGRLLSTLGDIGYEWLLSANSLINRVRGGMGLEYRSWSAAIKRRVKQATSFISRFEESVIEHARRRGCDGAICGHIHTPRIATVNGLEYFNTGDWVESCTALIEHGDGRFELVQPTEPRARIPARQARRSAFAPISIATSIA
jgi:UDP-2,3-diacylglucosamine pyrophosphatase LpxH